MAFQKMHDDGWTDEEIPEILTTDSTVSREKLIVIIDYVIDHMHGLGFLADKKRACDMFTRSRFASIVVGAPLVKLEKARDTEDDPEAPDLIGFNYSGFKEPGEHIGRASRPKPENSSKSDKKSFAEAGAEHETSVKDKDGDGGAANTSSLVKVLRFYQDSQLSRPVKRVKYNPLDLKSSLMTKREREGVDSYLAFLRETTGLQDFSVECLDADQRNAIPDYLVAFRAMVELRKAAVEGNVIREFIPVVEGYTTGKEKPYTDDELLYLRLVKKEDLETAPEFQVDSSVFGHVKDDDECDLGGDTLLKEPTNVTSGNLSGGAMDTSWEFKPSEESQGEGGFVADAGGFVADADGSFGDVAGDGW